MTMNFPVESSYLYSNLVRLRPGVSEIDMVNITRKNLRQLGGIFNRRYIAHGIEVGSTAIDDVVLDYSMSKVSFDLVLYNPETATERDHENLSGIKLLLDEEKPTVFIGPNGDPGSDEIEFVMKKWCEANEAWRYYPSVPRAQFLGLMQKADRIIGNSSAFCLETPLLRDDWEEAVVLVGTRNTPDRFLRDSRTGGSDRIVAEIRRFLGL